MLRPVEHPRFRFIERLGGGGTAEVARVFVADLNRQAALKYALPGDQDAQRTFSALVKREHQLVGNLKFPGLVRILEPPGQQGAYLLLEECQGKTLDQIGRTSDVSLALNLICALAVDLEFLRAVGIVHGDLKPENVFLPQDWQGESDGALHYLKLADFSLGKLADEDDILRLGLGTVGYMPPETINHNVITHRSDLFALGVIAYQLLTGRHPFMDEDCEPVHVNSRIREEEPQAVSQLRPQVSPQLAELVHSLLAKSDKDRPASAWSICQRLEELGATYPFRRALRPAHLIRRDSCYDDNIAEAVACGEKNKARLDSLCENSTEQLRLILTANFIRGNMVYDESRFAPKNTIYWPSLSRRRLLQRFREMSLSLKRVAIRLAVLGDAELAVRLQAVDREQADHVPRSLATLLRPLLRSRTIRRLSQRYALAAEKQELYGDAAGFFVRAGSLEGAERCAYQAAIALSRDHDNAEAIALLNQVIRYAELLGNRFFVRNLLMLRGDIHKEQGQTNDALMTYRELIDVYREHPKDKLLAETYKDLGDLYRIKQDSAKGLEALNEALRILRNLGDELETSRVLNNMANLYWLTAELPQALSKYRLALRLQRRLNADTEIASTLTNIGGVYAIQGRYSRSLSLLCQSLKLKQEIGHAGEIARTLNNIGYVHHVTGESGKAVECLSESLVINRRIGSGKEILYNLENLTSIMTVAGQLKESLDYFREGMNLSAELNDRAHLGIFNVNMATVYRRLGRYHEAGACLTNAQNICHEIDHKMLEISTTLQQASLRYAIGDNQAALELAIKALGNADLSQDGSSQLNALLLITKLSAEKSYIQRTERLTEELHLARERRLLGFNRIAFSLDHEMIEEGRILAEELQELPLQLAEDIEQAWTCNLMAEVFLETDRPDRAEPFIPRAVRAAQKSGLLPEMAVALALRGRYHYRRKAWEECFADFKKGLQLHKKIADSLVREDDRRSYQQKRSVLFLANEIKLLGKMLGEKERAGG